MGITSTESVTAQSDEYPEAFDSPLVHEQLWAPDRPTFADTPVHEQLWTPDRPAFASESIHEQLWTPIRPEFADEPIVTEIWGEQTGPGDITGNGNPATDPDGDGVYEDVNGDGDATVSDVQALFANQDTASQYPTAFDFNGDGETTVLDVQALFVEL
ncbi:dockerin type I domain-containing protein [Halorubrum kocurii]|uniref:dockerin type I domain-containing protein n=1 Tax=Halorubrum kocurii TaxID=478441 RepID=UPI0012688BEF|nr:dockerin type I domain-containing protein [Halorubrum kocurii]